MTSSVSEPWWPNIIFMEKRGKFCHHCRCDISCSLNPIKMIQHFAADISWISWMQTLVILTPTTPTPIQRTNHHHLYIWSNSLDANIKPHDYWNYNLSTEPGVGCCFSLNLSSELTLNKWCLNFWLKSEFSLQSETAPHPRPQSFKWLAESLDVMSLLDVMSTMKTVNENRDIWLYKSTWIFHVRHFTFPYDYWKTDSTNITFYPKPFHLQRVWKTTSVLNIIT